MEVLIEVLKNKGDMLLIVQNIAMYIIYIYPGIISLYWMDFLEARYTRITKGFFLKIFSISFMYNIAISWFLSYKERPYLYNIVLVVTALIIPFVLNKLKYSRVVECICEDLHITTCTKNVPFLLMEKSEDDATCYKVYLKNSEYYYIGYLDNYEYDMGQNNYLILKCFRKYRKELDSTKDKLVCENGKYDEQEKVYIKAAEIKCIEKLSDKRTNDIYGN